jgi:hypothetical protein
MYTITIVGEDMDGLDHGTIMDTYYGEISPWHETKASAKYAKRMLDTTGDWPEGRPKYRVVDGHRNDLWGAE